MSPHPRPGCERDVGAFKMRQRFTHHLNALHIMVRLTRLGVSRHRALMVARWWESLAHSWLYGRSVVTGTSQPAAWMGNTLLLACPVRAENAHDADHREIHRPAGVG
jgi:hypothetical protein